MTSDSQLLILLLRVNKIRRSTEDALKGSPCHRFQGLPVHHEFSTRQSQLWWETAHSNGARWRMG